MSGKILGYFAGAGRAAGGSGVTHRAGTVLVAAGFLLGGCSGERGTIGAVLAQTPDQRLVLREVPPNLAAGRAGLQPGDELLLIDGRDVRELSERDVHRALGGNAGDPVKLTLLRDGRVIRVTVRRTPPPPGKKG
jgi:C-terminal processing protease CtpA/Prc